MAKFQIASGGKALCRIVNTEAIFAPAAKALTQYLTKITGADCFADELTGPAIRFAKAPHGLNGYGWRMDDGDLILEAENDVTARYAVYALLEDLAGCRYYTSTAEVVPCDPDLTLEITDTVTQPAMIFREVYYRDYEELEFCYKRRVHPASQHAGWGFWCHSFATLIPVSQYFDEHPEYFAMIDGKRNPQGQPCLSNPEVLEIVCNNLAKHIAANPDKVFWSVSQDDHDRYCRCPECAKLDEIDGGPIGSVLNFVNKVAERFPDKMISTLAYWYTRKAPKVTRPAKNVHIMLCNIEAYRGEPLTEDPRNAGTVQELTDWAEICENVFLWDYNIQFANLVSPFPNLRTLAPNMRFFEENHVRSLFSQCNREKGGEMCELRGYMISKLMWDPKADDRAIMEDFVNGYFGAAAPHILHYIDTMHDASHACGAPLGIFNSPATARDNYLTPELVAGYSADFDDAEAAVANEPQLLERVRIARLPLIYAQLRLKYGTQEERFDLISRFARDARAQGLEKVEEWHITSDQFITDMLANLMHEKLEFSRATRPAMRLLGILDPEPQANRTGQQVLISYEHRLDETGNYLEHTAVRHDFTFYTINVDAGRFVGLKTVSYLDKREFSSFYQVELPAADCVTLRCEGADLAEAYEAIPGYLAENGLTQKGEIMDKETMGGTHLLYIPV